VRGFSRDMVFTLQGLVVLFAGALGHVAAPTLARLLVRRPHAATGAAGAA
jgi:simple sugar transport system permease protein